MSYNYTCKYVRKDGTEVVFTKKYNYEKKNKEIHDCGCGGTYRRVGKARHLRTNKHRKWEGRPKLTTKGKKECKICNTWVFKLDQHVKTNKHRRNWEKFEKAELPLEYTTEERR
jgi:hypothetical protein